MAGMQRLGRLQPGMEPQQMRKEERGSWMTSSFLCSILIWILATAACNTLLHGCPQRPLAHERVINNLG
jgi:hypothetical protein